LAGPAEDLVGGDLLVLLAAELLRVDRVQELPVWGQGQEEGVLGTRRATEGLELAVPGTKLVGVDGAALAWGERRDEDDWVGCGSGAGRGTQGEGSQGEGNSPAVCGHRETPQCGVHATSGLPPWAASAGATVDAG